MVERQQEESHDSLIKVSGEACYFDCNKKDACWSSLDFPFRPPGLYIFLPLDSPFFNAPFLDFQTIFHPSCCDGQCDVASSSERKEEKMLSG